MTNTQPPAIPDNATRVRTPSTSDRHRFHFHTDAPSAREWLARYPHLWERPITADSGPTPVHIWDGSGSHSGRLVVWSDGLIARGLVEPPSSVTDTLAWRAQFRSFAATERLLTQVLRARNLDQLGPEVWMPWRDAERVDHEALVCTATTRALAADVTATRTLEVTRHTVHCADGSTRTLWEVGERLEVTPPEATAGRRKPWSWQRWYYTDQAEAHLRMGELDDGLPPVVGTREAAALLGTTRDALAQAITRAINTPSDTNPLPDMVVFTRPRTHWRDPRPLKTWWTNRVGHGPGRPRKDHS
jgi:hypothetical protein